MRIISAIQYLDIDVERYLVETYLTKDEFSEKTMKYTILHYISSLDDLFLKEGFTGYNALHIDRVDPDRCISPKLMIDRRAEQPEWHKVRKTNPVLTRGIITATNYVSESAKLARLQFMAKVLSKQVKEYVRVDQIEVPGVTNALGQRRRCPGYDVKWRGMKIKFSRMHLQLNH
jgi:hypothetical protein